MNSIPELYITIFRHYNHLISTISTRTIYSTCSLPVWVSSIVLSGNNYAKIRLLNKFFHLSMINPWTFHNHQKLYILPCIDKAWTDVLNGNLKRAEGKDVVFLGDGRMDSPGFSAKFCTYVGMCKESRDILYLKVVDKRETSLKSTNMEKEGLVRSMDSMEKSGVTVKEVVTDPKSLNTRESVTPIKLIQTMSGMLPKICQNDSPKPGKKGHKPLDKRHCDPFLVALSSCFIKFFLILQIMFDSNDIYLTQVVSPVNKYWPSKNIWAQFGAVSKLFFTFFLGIASTPYVTSTIRRLLDSQSVTISFPTSFLIFFASS